mmetsp:Transcript_8812/g.26744  ORF Transcript_8812/g.26744 Transcript_8812/m.26744 type:complete len:266 (-) Transcript_8812:2474-3271(-)
MKACQACQCCLASRTTLSALETAVEAQPRARLRTQSYARTLYADESRKRAGAPSRRPGLASTVGGGDNSGAAQGLRMALRRRQRHVDDYALKPRRLPPDFPVTIAACKELDSMPSTRSRVCPGSGNGDATPTASRHARVALEQDRCGRFDVMAWSRHGMSGRKNACAGIRSSVQRACRGCQTHTLPRAGRRDTSAWRRARARIPSAAAPLLLGRSRAVRRTVSVVVHVGDRDGGWPGCGGRGCFRSTCHLSDDFAPTSSRRFFGS